MKSGSGLVIAFVLMALLIPAIAAEETIGGDQGWYVIHCNEIGAKVYLDDKYVGTIEKEILTVPAYSSGTPYQTITVKKYGFTPYTDTLTRVPSKGEQVDLYATLNAAPQTTQTLLGGDMGWYVVHCNVDGATVLFDSSNKGEISQGTVYVPVYSTGTPYRTLTVKKEGFSTYTAAIEDIPAKGETVDLYATLNPAVTTAATTSSPALVGGDIGWYKIHCNVDGATVSLNNEEKGKIADGSLSVQVYVTGTPYRTYTVYKAGYVPYSGSIDHYPKKGETVDLYATLNAQTETPAPVPTTKSPLPSMIPVAALIIGSFVAVLAAARK